MGLKVSVSGIRGIWSDSFNIKTISEFAQAFASYVLEKGGKVVLIGRDGRPSGDVLSRCVSSILNMMGLDVVDLDIVPTPVVLFGVREYDFDAGIVFSASHNPLDWNAFKFIKKEGVFTNEDDLNIINKYISYPMKMSSWQDIGSYKKDMTIVDSYLTKILTIVDVDIIQKSNLKVLLDPVNASGSLITKKLFNLLNINSFYIHDEPHGHFERSPEPMPEHLQHMKDIVISNNIDVGFAQDPDADRLVLVDEKGDVLSEELTGVLALKNLLDRGEYGSIVLNMSTSSRAEVLNKKFHQKTYYSKVGEANVVQKMIETSSFYGIEGNGGVIYPKANMCRDSLVGILLILEMLAREKQTLSYFVETFPNRVIIKEKYKFHGKLDHLFSEMQHMFNEAKINDEDGLRLYFDDDSWIHIRSSNTEPLVRLIVESNSQEQAKNLINKVNVLFLC